MFYSDGKRGNLEKGRRPMMKNKVKICFADGKAYLEISDGCLVWIGDEKFIRSLDERQRWDLAHTYIFTIKYGRKNIKDGIFTRPVTVH